MDQTSVSTDTTSRLREAVRKLEAYALHNSERASSSSISKTIALVRSLLPTRIDTKPKKHKHQRHPPNKEEVLHAVELINRQRLFIETLKKGTDTEQKLAESFTQTIDAYNASCDKRIHECIAKGNRLARFFANNIKESGHIPPKIFLSQKVTVQHHYPAKAPSEIIPTALSTPIKIRASITVPKQSAELFHMKALSLLEKYGIASNPEARALVKHSPIHATIGEDQTLCTLTQVLNLFPGQTVVVKGTSALDPKTLSLRGLFPETFCLTLESTQTAFPHPSQRHGWSLAYQLLPENPQRIDLLDKAASLFQRKAKTVTELLHQGRLLKYAKALLAQKKECFQLHHKEMIGLHRQLAEAIVNAAPASLLLKNQNTILSRYFEALLSHPNPYSWLTETNQMIRENFIAKPQKALLEAILNGKSTDLGSHKPKTRYHEAKRILDQIVENAGNELQQQILSVKLLNEKNKLEYILCVGQLLGQASKPIMLQYLSEDLVFQPPALSPFESKVQGAAYIHLKDFLDEINSSPASNADSVFKRMKDDINADIALFKDTSTPAIANELAIYFQQRYSSLSNI